MASNQEVRMSTAGELEPVVGGRYPVSAVREAH
jgi:hypothetical protein